MKSVSGRKYLSGSPRHHDPSFVFIAQDLDSLVRVGSMITAFHRRSDSVMDAPLSTIRAGSPESVECFRSAVQTEARRVNRIAIDAQFVRSNHPSGLGVLAPRINPVAITTTSDEGSCADNPRHNMTVPHVYSERLVNKRLTD